ncbi:MAG TPA: hypothetical protein VIR63_04855 [Pontiella sp.]
MKILKAGKRYEERLEREAFQEEHNHRWKKGTRRRRNAWIGLFAAGFISIIGTALTNHLILSMLALFFTALSLVIMTKYDTQLFFLKILTPTDRKQDPDISD